MSSSVPTVSAPEALRVLVVDDNASLLRFLVSAFSANGCAVSQAAAAEQALSLITDEPFDLVVSDIKMPGLSGLDLLRAVKGKQPGTPVVLITGNPSVNSAVFGLRHGAYDYLPKPFSIREILQRSFEDLVATGGKEILPLTTGSEPLEAIAAVIPGVGRSMGVVCLARAAATGGFLPDERELLLGYAQTTAVALQKLILRENVERNLVDTIT